MNRKLNDEQIIKIRRIGQLRAQLRALAAKLPTDEQLSSDYHVSKRTIQYHVERRGVYHQTAVSRFAEIEADIHRLAEQWESFENADRQ